jgi:hypothetical protein
LSTQEVPVTPTGPAQAGFAGFVSGHSRLRGRLPRLRALLHRRRLDDQLAAGVDPRSDPALAVRARRLTSHRYRRRLATSVESLVEEFDARPGSRLSSAAPVRLDHVAQARGTLMSIAGALRDVDPVNAGGVVLALRLITDPESPLYAGTARELQIKTHAALKRLIAESHPWCELPPALPPPTPRGGNGDG